MLRVPREPRDQFIWCGPYIVGLLLGVDYEEAYRIQLSDVRRAAAEAVRAQADRLQALPHPEELRRAKPARITGTYPHQVARVLTKRGVRCNFEDARYLKPRMTVQAFTRRHTKPGRAYLIDAADHWLVVMDGVMYNSHFKPTPVEKAPRYRLARIQWWAEVKPRPEAFA